MKHIDEKELRSIVKPILADARPGDWEHTIRTVAFGKYLLKHEKGEASIVIPALYLHDLGWSDVSKEEFLQRASSPIKRTNTESAQLHMHYSAVRAKTILDELGIDERTSERIAYIASVHDKPDTVFASKDHSAYLVVEADRMDRYGPKSLKRYQALFGDQYFKTEPGKLQKIFLYEGLATWFKTETGKQLSRKLFSQMNEVADT